MMKMKIATLAALAAMTMAASAATQPQAQLRLKPGTVTADVKVAATTCDTACKGRRDGNKKDDAPVVLAATTCDTSCKLGRRDG